MRLGCWVGEKWGVTMSRMTESSSCCVIRSDCSERKFPLRVKFVKVLSHDRMDWNRYAEFICAKVHLWLEWKLAEWVCKSEFDWSLILMYSLSTVINSCHSWLEFYIRRAYFAKVLCSDSDLQKYYLVTAVNRKIKKKTFQSQVCRSECTHDWCEWKLCKFNFQICVTTPQGKLLKFDCNNIGINQSIT